MDHEDGRGNKKWASELHRTATTTYPCSGQGLGDSAGAGRIGLARGKIKPRKAVMKIMVMKHLIISKNIPRCPCPPPDKDFLHLSRNL